MISRPARLLMALSAAALLHGAVLMIRFQSRAVDPAPHQIRPITISLAAFQPNRQTADTRQVPDMPASVPEIASPAPPVKPQVVKPRAVKDKPKRVVQRRKQVTPPVRPEKRKKSAAPAMQAKSSLANKPTSAATPGDEPSPQKSSSAAEMVVVKAVPVYRNNPLPQYPPLARRRGLEGTVYVEALISSAGRVVEAGVGRSSGHRLLDLAALRAVNRWSFTSGTVNGRPAEMRVTVPVHFTLQ